MADAEIRGLNELDNLGRAMKAAGSSSGLRKELGRELKKVTDGTRKDLKAAIPGALPTRGGLAALVAGRTSFGNRITTSGRNVGVRIRQNGKFKSLERMNKSGSFRHPVYKTGEWVTQTAGVTKGFLDEVFEKSKPDLQRGVLEAIQNIKHDIDRSV